MHPKTFISLTELISKFKENCEFSRGVAEVKIGGPFNSLREEWRIKSTVLQSNSEPTLFAWHKIQRNKQRTELFTYQLRAVDYIIEIKSAELLELRCCGDCKLGGDNGLLLRCW